MTDQYGCEWHKDMARVSQWMPAVEPPYTWCDNCRCLFGAAYLKPPPPLKLSRCRRVLGALRSIFTWLLEVP